MTTFAASVTERIIHRTRLARREKRSLGSTPPTHRRRSRKTRLACATFTAVRCPLTGSKGRHQSNFSRHFNRHFSRHFSGHSVGTLESKSLCKREFTPPCDPTAAARAFGVHFGQAGRATPLRRADASLPQALRVHLRPPSNHLV